MVTSGFIKTGHLIFNIKFPLVCKLTTRHMYFQKKLCCGIWKTIRLYEIGKKQLLREIELIGMPRMIRPYKLQVIGEFMKAFWFIDAGRVLRLLKEIILLSCLVPMLVICRTVCIL